jgi:hypothetical protein
MDRRNFLRLAALSGLAVALPAPRGASATPGAESLPPYEGPLWLSIHVPGGWDPAFLCDPKGKETGITKLYAEGDIAKNGSLRFAPIGGNATFFNKYASRLCVVNGIDTATGTHDAGPAHVWSGTLRGGWPCFSAVVAAALGALRPLSFISNGGYDQTAGIVAKTVGDIANAAGDPNIMGGSGSSVKHFHAPGTMNRIMAAQSARLEAMREAQTLPSVSRAVSELYAARLAAPELRKLTEMLPNGFSDNKMLRQAQLVFAAYRSGLAVSATIVADVNVDTHSNHDVVHLEELSKALVGLDLILEEAESLGIADKIMVSIGSDFGRGPLYNSQNGKDHYSITSMMFMGEGIPGGRVVGATDDEGKPMKVNPKTLALDESGVRVTPAHVHKALRAKAGVLGTGADALWPVYVPEDMPLFT